MWKSKRRFSMKQTHHTMQERKYLENVKSAKVGFYLKANPEISRQIEMIDLNEKDLKNIQAIKFVIDEHLDVITDAFYSTILKIDHLKASIEKHSSVDRLKKTLETHLSEMFSGVIDEQFVEKRYRIANAHVRIGLEPKWYMGAFQNLQDSILNIIQNTFTDQELSIQITKAVTKLLNFEQQIVLDAYEAQNLKLREAQYEKVKQELKQHVGAMSEELAALAEQTSASVEQLIASSSEISRSFENSMMNSESTQNMASDGKNRINRLDEKVKIVSEGLNEMNQFVSDLKQSFEKMKGVTAIVQEIANQTHLLALNASIEAARAGTQGAGFSVVAREVKKLSEGTKESVNNIQNIIQESQIWLGDVVQSLEKVVVGMAEGQTESASTNQLFEEIFESMKNNIRDLQTNEQDLRLLIEVIESIGLATQKVSQSAEKLNVQASQV